MELGTQVEESLTESSDCEAVESFADVDRSLVAPLDCDRLEPAVPARLTLETASETVAAVLKGAGRRTPEGSLLHPAKSG